jgi:hypothetical protein
LLGMVIFCSGVLSACAARGRTKPAGHVVIKIAQRQTVAIRRAGAAVLPFNFHNGQ